MPLTKHGQRVATDAVAVRKRQKGEIRLLQPGQQTHARRSRKDRRKENPPTGKQTIDTKDPRVVSVGPRSPTTKHTAPNRTERRKWQPRHRAQRHRMMIR